MSDSLRVIIQSPIEIVWEGEVQSLSAENAEGVFDILPGHARFMSLINSTPLVLELQNTKQKTFAFENALLYVADDLATVYVPAPPPKP